MNKSLFFLFSILLVLAGCSKDSINETEYVEEIVQVNLETFIPSEDLDNTPNGKYVGVIGHHTNRSIHGKIYINAGYLNQYNAVVKMTNGLEVEFKGTPQNYDNSIILYKSPIAIFEVNLENFESSVTAPVNIFTEDTDGYITVKKTIRGSSPFVYTGTYMDTSSPNFNGNWDLIGDSITLFEDFSSTLGGADLLDITTLYQEIATLSISHSGSSNPIIVNNENDFQEVTGGYCYIGPQSFQTNKPILASNTALDDNLTQLGLGNFIRTGEQVSMINGVDCTWSLNYDSEIDEPEIFVTFPERYLDNSCITTTLGSWSWNGRSGTITADTF